MPTVHFLRSVWTRKKSWLYSLGSREERGPGTALSSSSRLHPPPFLAPASLWHSTVLNLLLITEKNVEEENKARSLSK